MRGKFFLARSLAQVRLNPAGITLIWLSLLSGEGAGGSHYSHTRAKHVLTGLEGKVVLNMLFSSFPMDFLHSCLEVLHACTGDSGLTSDNQSASISVRRSMLLSVRIEIGFE